MVRRFSRVGRQLAVVDIEHLGFDSQNLGALFDLGRAATSEMGAGHLMVADVAVGHADELDLVSQLGPPRGGAACFQLAVVGMGSENDDPQSLTRRVVLGRGPGRNGAVSPQGTKVERATSTAPYLTRSLKSILTAPIRREIDCKRWSPTRQQRFFVLPAYQSARTSHGGSRIHDQNDRRHRPRRCRTNGAFRCGVLNFRCFTCRFNLRPRKIKFMKPLSKMRRGTVRGGWLPPQFVVRSLLYWPTARLGAKRGPIYWNFPTGSECRDV